MLSPEQPMRDTPEAAAQESPRPALLASPWHTAMIVLVILGVSALSLARKSGEQMTAQIATHRSQEYAATLAWEWLLTALTVGGVWLRSRGAGVRALFGVYTARGLERRSYRRLDDAAAAIIFWLASTAILGILGLVLQRAGGAAPEQVLTALAPHDAPELLLFLALSITAGFCEELVFRGYLMQQATRLAAEAGRETARPASLWISRHAVWIGAFTSSLIFGAAHLYEGASGVIAIAIFGLLFAWLAVRRHSLRAGMMAHAWHDAMSGIALFLLARAHAR